MNTAQAIGYYTFETLASAVILVITGVVAILAGGALADRWRRFFGTDSDESVSPGLVQVDQIGRT